MIHRNANRHDPKQFDISLLPRHVSPSHATSTRHNRLTHSPHLRTSRVRARTHARTLPPSLPKAVTPSPSHSLMDLKHIVMTDTHPRPQIVAQNPHRRHIQFQPSCPHHRHASITADHFAPRCVLGRCAGILSYVGIFPVHASQSRAQIVSIPTPSVHHRLQSQESCSASHWVNNVFCQQKEHMLQRRPRHLPFQRKCINSSTP